MSSKAPFEWGDPEVVSFHSPCPDGTACEILVREIWPGVTLVPYTHGKTSLDEKSIAQKNVWCLDWCPKYDVLLRLASVVRQLVVVDHHPTALDTVAELERKQAIRSCQLQISVVLS